MAPSRKKYTLRCMFLFTFLSPTDSCSKTCQQRKHLSQQWLTTFAIAFLQKLVVSTQPGRSTRQQRFQKSPQRESIHAPPFSEPHHPASIRSQRFIAGRAFLDKAEGRTKQHQSPASPHLSKSDPRFRSTGLLDTPRQHSRSPTVCPPTFAASTPSESLPALSPGPELQTPAPSLGVETDAHKIRQREKQIGYGKSTKGYANYLTLVPIDERDPDNENHPMTPCATQQQSKRSWDGQLKTWRRLLSSLGQRYG